EGFVGIINLNSLIIQRLEDPLVVSATYSQDSVQKWLDAVSSTEFFWNAITAVVAPELFQTSCHAILEVLKQTQLPKKLVPVHWWLSIFSGLEVIVNRVTWSHQDPGGALSHYNLLVSLGIGHDATFSIEDLEAELGYGPGTMNFILGKVLMHSVGPWKTGEQFVIAHFMKDKVHDRVGVSRPGFPVLNNFLNLLGHKYKKKLRTTKSRTGGGGTS
ncbi:hypothetical protein BDR05DRAFT_880087, partial [Suillus weaverae]